jgi:hypothetical protein
MGYLLQIKCVDSRANVHILASTSVSLTLTTVQVPKFSTRLRRNGLQCSAKSTSYRVIKPIYKGICWGQRTAGWTLYFPQHLIFVGGVADLLRLSWQRRLRWVPLPWDSALGWRPDTAWRAAGRSACTERTGTGRSFVSSISYPKWAKWKRTCESFYTVLWKSIKTFLI